MDALASLRRGLIVRALYESQAVSLRRWTTLGLGTVRTPVVVRLSG